MALLLLNDLRSPTGPFESQMEFMFEVASAWLGLVKWRLCNRRINTRSDNILCVHLTCLILIGAGGGGGGYLGLIMETSGSSLGANTLSDRRLLGRSEFKLLLSLSLATKLFHGKIMSKSSLCDLHDVRSAFKSICRAFPSNKWAAAVALDQWGSFGLETGTFKEF